LKSDNLKVLLTCPFDRSCFTTIEVLSNLKMRSFSVAITLAVILQDVSAFPAIANELFSKTPQLKIRSGAPDTGAALLGFDAAKQYVSNTGDHAFIAPGPDNQRGPCPVLNTMANHGYLPHNGIGSIQDLITGTYQAFGMGLDLSGFLGVYGAIFDGDLTSYSIVVPTPTSSPTSVFSVSPKVPLVRITSTKATSHPPVAICTNRAMTTRFNSNSS
jgi:hypothetical protein